MMNRAKKTVLIVDDDVEICNLLKDFLQSQACKVCIAHDGHAMQREMKEHHIDLVVLDIMLPGDSGITLCQELRYITAVPIIMVSANGSETDRVLGLEVGADDYLVKPFSSRELLARIKALLRRISGELHKRVKVKGGLELLPDIAFCKWRIDRNKRLLINPDGLVVPLSMGEYDLLLVFLEHAKRVLTRNQLLELTRGREAQPFDRTIDVQVGWLRKKLEKDPKAPEYIKTVRGGGYQFCVDAEIILQDD